MEIDDLFLYRTALSDRPLLLDSVIWLVSPSDQLSAQNTGYRSEVNVAIAFW